MQLVFCAIRGSLRKFLDTHQLSTIIEILPLHFLKVLSLSIYATSHPPEPRLEALAPVTVIQCTGLPLVCSNHAFRCEKPLPRQSGLHHREQKEVTQVPGLDCKDDGSTAAQESSSENPCQMGGMDRGILMVQQDAPQSSSWALFSQFLGNLWEGNCSVPLYSHCPLMLKWYCCHMTTCS